MRKTKKFFSRMNTFVNTWGRSYDELCTSLGVNESIESLLVLDYFYDKHSKKWFSRVNTLYSEEQRLLLQTLIASNN